MHTTPTPRRAKSMAVAAPTRGWPRSRSPRARRPQSRHGSFHQRAGPNRRVLALADRRSSGELAAERHRGSSPRSLCTDHRGVLDGTTPTAAQRMDGSTGRRPADRAVPADIAGRAVPATVPGVVHTDLLAAGLIPIPTGTAPKTTSNGSGGMALRDQVRLAAGFRGPGRSGVRGPGHRRHHPAQRLAGCRHRQHAPHVPICGR